MLETLTTYLEVWVFEPHDSSPTLEEGKRAKEIKFNHFQWFNQLCFHNETLIKTLDIETWVSFPG